MYILPLCNMICDVLHGRNLMIWSGYQSGFVWLPKYFCSTDECFIWHCKHRDLLWGVCAKAICFQILFELDQSMLMETNNDNLTPVDVATSNVVRVWTLNFNQSPTLNLGSWIICSSILHLHSGYLAFSLLSCLTNLRSLFPPGSCSLLLHNWFLSLLLTSSVCLSN